MRRYFPLVLSLFAATILATCSSDETSPPSSAPPPGSAGAAGGAGADASAGAAGGAGVDGGAGADAGSARVYSPAGCSYTTELAETRGNDFRADDPALGADPAPKRVRIGVGGALTLGAAGYADPSSSVAVAWDTDLDTLGSRIRYGTASGALDKTASGVSYGLPGTWPNRIHQVHVCGLSPATTYFYRVGGGSAGQEIWSNELSFTTQRAAADPGSVSIGVSGDSRDSIDVVWKQVQDRFHKLGVDMQLFSGDAILLALPDSGKTFAAWFDSAASAGTLGTHPLLVVGGNHEAMAVQWLSNMPAPGGGATQGLYWSFDVASAHVVLFDDLPVSVDVKSVPTAEAEILAFLESDLAAANARRDKTPFLVVLHHKGALSTGKHSNEDDIKRLRAAVMPLFSKHKVDLVLNGHDHNYERSKPVTGTFETLAIQTDPTAGTTYVVCAGAGAKGYAPGPGAAYTEKKAGYDDGAHVGLYGVLTLSAKTLGWRAYGIKKDATQPSGDTLLDEFQIAK
jgi:hypothetical protein